MTTLAAIDDGEGVIWLGADTQMSEGATVDSLDAVKWEISRDWALGIAGSPAVLPLAARLCRAMEAEALEIDPWRIAREIRERLVEIGWQSDQQGSDQPMRDLAILLACRAGLFELHESLEWARKVPPGSMTSCGSGRAFARGADHALRSLGAEARVRGAVEAGIALDCYSGGFARVYAFTVGAA